MQVGATAFVGLLEGGRGISWTVLYKSILGWVFTLIVVGFSSALMMALGIFTPNLHSLKAAAQLKDVVDSTSMDAIGRFKALPICTRQNDTLNVRVHLLSVP
jgi:hypothetical protein